MGSYQKNANARSIREFKTAKSRREYLEKEVGISLPHIANFIFTETDAVGKNIENLIGASQIPLGIAGPIRISGEYADADFFIPLATTEGALVASVSRGCKAVTESGGTVVRTENSGMTRGPVFATGSLEKSQELKQWIMAHERDLKKTAESTSFHITFKKVTISMVADYIFLRFSYDTSDAMGMNMVTIATEKIVEYIEEQTGVKCLSLAGNFDIDKKPAWLNFIHNRGFSVWAEARIKKEIVQTVLKTTAERVYDVWLGKCMVGSAMSGSLGFNAHYANIIAALFIATGQDPGHIGEGSMGITTVKVLPKGDLYFSVYLPSVIAGTIGGGTRLPTQQEALQILGVNGKGNIGKFIEIIGGTVLAGELSLLASLAEGSLAKAHKTLGRRGRK